VPRANDSLDQGFTLAEVLVAMLMVSTVTIGVAQLFALAVVSTRTARNQTWATALAASKMEQLRALTWKFDVQGAPLTDVTTDLSVDPAGGNGGGLSASPPDSLDRNVAGYVDYIDGSGRWVGTGTIAPATAMYIRRWNVAPLPANPANTVILRVLVTTVAHEAVRVAVSKGGRVRLSEDPLIVSLKTRKAA